MKKLAVFVVVLLVAVAWFIGSKETSHLQRVTDTEMPAETVSKAKSANVSPEPTKPNQSGPTASRPSTSATAVDTRPPANSTTKNEPAEPADKTAPPSAPTAPAYPQLSLTEVLQPGNRYNDSFFGVSLTYPEGWSVRSAQRWGEGNRENTVFFAPPEGSQAGASMYYQQYPDGPPPMGNAEAMLREMALKKEASRSAGGANDYKNDPDSFVFRQIDGHPSLSYFATYSRNGEVQAEYFMRILGPKGYVMFFVRGPAKDVQAAIPDVHKMGSTVTPP